LLAVSCTVSGLHFTTKRILTWTQLLSDPTPTYLDPI
jgi:hypothetical protein